MRQSRSMTTGRRDNERGLSWPRVDRVTQSGVVTHGREFSHRSQLLPVPGRHPPMGASTSTEAVEAPCDWRGAIYGPASVAAGVASGGLAGASAAGSGARAATPGVASSARASALADPARLVLEDDRLVKVLVTHPRTSSLVVAADEGDEQSASTAVAPTPRLREDTAGPLRGSTDAGQAVWSSGDGNAAAVSLCARRIRSLVGAPSTLDTFHRRRAAAACLARTALWRERRRVRERQRQRLKPAGGGAVGSGGAYGAAGGERTARSACSNPRCCVRERALSAGVPGRSSERTATGGAGGAEEGSDSPTLGHSWLTDGELSAVRAASIDGATDEQLRAGVDALEEVAQRAQLDQVNASQIRVEPLAKFVGGLLNNALRAASDDSLARRALDGAAQLVRTTACEALVVSLAVACIVFDREMPSDQSRLIGLFQRSLAPMLASLDANLRTDMAPFITEIALVPEADASAPQFAEFSVVEANLFVGGRGVPPTSLLVKRGWKSPVVNLRLLKARQVSSRAFQSYTVVDHPAVNASRKKAQALYLAYTSLRAAKSSDEAARTPCLAGIRIVRAARASEAAKLVPAEYEMLDQNIAAPGCKERVFLCVRTISQGAGQGGASAGAGDQLGGATSDSGGRTRVAPWTRALTRFYEERLAAAGAEHATDLTFLAADVLSRMERRSIEDTSQSDSNGVEFVLRGLAELLNRACGADGPGGSHSRALVLALASTIARHKVENLQQRGDHWCCADETCRPEAAGAAARQLLEALIKVTSVANEDASAGEALPEVRAQLLKKSSSSGSQRHSRRGGGAASISILLRGAREEAVRAVAGFPDIVALSQILCIELDSDAASDPRRAVLLDQLCRRFVGISTSSRLVEQENLVVAWRLVCAVVPATSRLAGRTSVVSRQADRAIVALARTVITELVVASCETLERVGGGDSPPSLESMSLHEALSQPVVRVTADALDFVLRSAIAEVTSGAAALVRPGQSQNDSELWQTEARSTRFHICHTLAQPLLGALLAIAESDALVPLAAVLREPMLGLLDVLDDSAAAQLSTADDTGASLKPDAACTVSAEDVLVPVEVVVTPSDAALDVAVCGAQGVRVVVDAARTRLPTGARLIVTPAGGGTVVDTAAPLWLPLAVKGDRVRLSIRGVAASEEDSAGRFYAHVTVVGMTRVLRMSEVPVGIALSTALMRVLGNLGVWGLAGGVADRLVSPPPRERMSRMEVWLKSRLFAGGTPQFASLAVDTVYHHRQPIPAELVEAALAKVDLSVSSESVAGPRPEAAFTAALVHGEGDALFLHELMTDHAVRRPLALAALKAKSHRELVEPAVRAAIAALLHVTGHVADAASLAARLRDIGSDDGAGIAAAISERPILIKLWARGSVIRTWLRTLLRHAGPASNPSSLPLSASLDWAALPAASPKRLCDTVVARAAVLLRVEPSWTRMSLRLRRQLSDMAAERDDVGDTPTSPGRTPMPPPLPPVFRSPSWRRTVSLSEEDAVEAEPSPARSSDTHESELAAVDDEVSDDDPFDPRSGSAATGSSASRASDAAADFYLAVWQGLSRGNKRTFRAAARSSLSSACMAFLRATNVEPDALLLEMRRRTCSAAARADGARLLSDLVLRAQSPLLRRDACWVLTHASRWQALRRVPGDLTALRLNPNHHLDGCGASPAMRVRDAHGILLRLAISTAQLAAGIAGDERSLSAEIEGIAIEDAEARVMHKEDAAHLLCLWAMEVRVSDIDWLQGERAVPALAEIAAAAPGSVLATVAWQVLLVLVRKCTAHVLIETNGASAGSLTHHRLAGTLGGAVRAFGIQASEALTAPVAALLDALTAESVATAEDEAISSSSSTSDAREEVRERAFSALPVLILMARSGCVELVEGLTSQRSLELLARCVAAPRGAPGTSRPLDAHHAASLPSWLALRLLAVKLLRYILPGVDRKKVPSWLLPCVCEAIALPVLGAPPGEAAASESEVVAPDLTTASVVGYGMSSVATEAAKLVRSLVAVHQSGRRRQDGGESIMAAEGRETLPIEAARIASRGLHVISDDWPAQFFATASASGAHGGDPEARSKMVALVVALSVFCPQSRGLLGCNVVVYDNRRSRTRSRGIVVDADLHAGVVTVECSVAGSSSDADAEAASQTLVAPPHSVFVIDASVDLPSEFLDHGGLSHSFVEILRNLPSRAERMPALLTESVSPVHRDTFASWLSLGVMRLLRRIVRQTTRVSHLLSDDLLGLLISTAVRGSTQMPDETLARSALIRDVLGELKGSPRASPLPDRPPSGSPHLVLPTTPLSSGGPSGGSSSPDVQSPGSPLVDVDGVDVTRTAVRDVALIARERDIDEHQVQPTTYLAPATSGVTHAEEVATDRRGGNRSPAAAAETDLLAMLRGRDCSTLTRHLVQFEQDALTDSARRSLLALLATALAVGHDVPASVLSGARVVQLLKLTQVEGIKPAREDQAKAERQLSQLRSVVVRALLNPSTEPAIEFASELASAAAAELSAWTARHASDARSARICESTHPYEDNMDTGYVRIRIRGASALTVYFDRRCSLERGCDVLSFYKPGTGADGREQLTRVATVSERASALPMIWSAAYRPITVVGDTLAFRFTSDESGTDWGYRFTVVGTPGRSATGVSGGDQPSADIALWIMLVLSDAKPAALATPYVLNALASAVRRESHIRKDAVNVLATALRVAWPRITFTSDNGMVVPPSVVSLVPRLLVALARNDPAVRGEQYIATQLVQSLMSARLALPPERSRHHTAPSLLATRFAAASDYGYRSLDDVMRSVSKAVGCEGWGTFIAAVAALSGSHGVELSRLRQLAQAYTGLRAPSESEILRFGRGIPLLQLETSGDACRAALDDSVAHRLVVDRPPPAQSLDPACDPAACGMSRGAGSRSVIDVCVWPPELCAVGQPFVLRLFRARVGSTAVKRVSTFVALMRADDAPDATPGISRFPISDATFESGIIWPQSKGVHEPGAYQFRCFAASADDGKWDCTCVSAPFVAGTMPTSAPVIVAVETALSLSAAGVSAAVLLEQLHEQKAEEACATESTATADTSGGDMGAAGAGGAGGAGSPHHEPIIDAHDVLSRAPSTCHGALAAVRATLQSLNDAVFSLLPFVDLGDHPPRPSSLACSIVATRELIWPALKRRHVRRCLVESETESERVEVRIRRVPAGDSARRGSSTVFGQLLSELQLAPDVHIALRRPGLPVRVVFVGEGASDAGGPLREVLELASAELMSDALPLFCRSPNSVSGIGSDRDAFVPTPSQISSSALAGYRLVGQLMGLALRTDTLLPLRLPMLVWKLLCQCPVALDDLADVDHVAVAAFRHMQSLEDDVGRARARRSHSDERSESVALHVGSPGAGAAHPGGSGASPGRDTVPSVGTKMLDGLFDQGFSVVRSDGSVVEVVPDGRSKVVTVDNVGAYLAAAIPARLHESQRQIDAMCDGLDSVVPIAALRLLSPCELEELVCGRDVFDVELLKSVTQYEDGVSAKDASTAYLWAALESFSDEDRRRFLRFVWGRSRLPVRRDDFSTPFKVHRMHCASDPDSMLPKAATCFFSLTWPAYSSAAIARERLRYAVRHCASIDTDFNTRDDDWVAADAAPGDGAAAGTPPPDR